MGTPVSQPSTTERLSNVLALALVFTTALPARAYWTGSGTCHVVCNSVCIAIPGGGTVCTPAIDQTFPGTYTVDTRAECEAAASDATSRCNYTQSGGGVTCTLSWAVPPTCTGFDSFIGAGAGSALGSGESVDETHGFGSFLFLGPEVGRSVFSPHESRDFGAFWARFEWAVLLNDKSTWGLKNGDALKELKRSVTPAVWVALLKDEEFRKLLASSFDDIGVLERIAALIAKKVEDMRLDEARMKDPDFDVLYREFLRAFVHTNHEYDMAKLINDAKDIYGLVGGVVGATPGPVKWGKEGWNAILAAKDLSAVYRGLGEVVAEAKKDVERLQSEFKACKGDAACQSRISDKLKVAENWLQWANEDYGKVDRILKAAKLGMDHVVGPRILDELYVGKIEMARTEASKLSVWYEVKTGEKRIKDLETALKACSSQQCLDDRNRELGEARGKLDRVKADVLKDIAARARRDGEATLSDREKEILQDYVAKMKGYPSSTSGRASVGEHGTHPGRGLGAGRDAGRPMPGGGRITSGGVVSVPVKATPVEPSRMVEVNAGEAVNATPIVSFLRDAEPRKEPKRLEVPAPAIEFKEEMLNVSPDKFDREKFNSLMQDPEFRKGLEAYLASLPDGAISKVVQDAKSLGKSIDHVLDEIVKDKGGHFLAEIALHYGAHGLADDLLKVWEDPKNFQISKAWDAGKSVGGGAAAGLTLYLKFKEWEEHTKEEIAKAEARFETDDEIAKWRIDQTNKYLNRFTPQGGKP